MNHPGFNKDLILLIVFLLVMLLACYTTAICLHQRFWPGSETPIRMASPLMEEIACH